MLLDRVLHSHCMTIGEIANFASIAGVAISLFFGVWSIFRGGFKKGSPAAKFFIVLLLLYCGQSVSTKFFGQPFLSRDSFTTLVMVLCVWIMWARNQDES